MHSENCFSCFQAAWYLKKVFSHKIMQKIGEHDCESYFPFVDNVHISKCGSTLHSRLKQPHMMLHKLIKKQLLQVYGPIPFHPFSLPLVLEGYLAPWNRVTRGSGWNLPLRIRTALQEAVTSSVVVAETQNIISTRWWWTDVTKSFAWDGIVITLLRS